MTIRWLLATLHLFGLGIGLGSVFVRGRAFSRAQRPEDLSSVFVADNLWGLAALLWLSTGLLRAFGNFEKGTAYYLGHPLFHAKLGLFILVFLLELWPMVTLIRWRRMRAKNLEIDLTPVRRFSQISYIEGGIVCVIVFLATALARGMFA